MNPQPPPKLSNTGASQNAIGPETSEPPGELRAHGTLNAESFGDSGVQGTPNFNLTDLPHLQNRVERPSVEDIPSANHPYGIHSQNIFNISHPDHQVPYYHGVPPPGYLHAYPQYNYPQSEYNPSHGYGPQFGGGDYHFRRNIKLSPHAPKSVRKAAQYRAEGGRQKHEGVSDAEAGDVQASSTTNHLEGLDAAAVEELTTNNWVPTPSGSPTPGSHTQPSTETPPDTLLQATPTPSGHTQSPSRTPPPSETSTLQMANPVLLFTPTPRTATSRPNAPGLRKLLTPSPHHAASHGDHLFSPVPAPTLESKGKQANDGDIFEDIMEALEMEHIKLPPGPSHLERDSETRDSDNATSSDDDQSTDKEHTKTGRPSNTFKEITSVLEENMNNLFEEASRNTGKPVMALIEHWHNTSKYGIKTSSWNLYQAYFKKNMDKERRRAGLSDGDAQECWKSFKKNPNYAEILTTALEYEQTQQTTTFTQCQKTFRKLSEVYENQVANKASRERIETFFFMAGNSINEDSNLTFLFTSNGLEGFIHEKLQMTPSEFTALAKTQIYSHISDEFIKERAAIQEDQTNPAQPSESYLPPPSEGMDEDKSEGDSSDSNNDNQATSTIGAGRTADDDRNDIKKLFKKLFRAHGLSVTTFPWINLPNQLLKWRAQIVGWPAEVPFPQETLVYDKVQKKKKSSQGIKLLCSKYARILLAALMDPTNPIKIFSNLSQKDLKQGKEPVIVCGAPPYKSKYQAGRRLFVGGMIDNGGPPAPKSDLSATRIKKSKKRSPSGPPSSDIEVVTISSSPGPSTRTRSRSQTNPQPKESINVDSDESDNDDIPLVKRVARPTRPIVLVESDSDGASAIDPKAIVHVSLL